MRRRSKRDDEFHLMSSKPVMFMHLVVLWFLWHQDYLPFWGKVLLSSVILSFIICSLAVRMLD